MYKFLRAKHRETVMSNQILRCGTSIGANVAESIYAQSNSDFVNKLSIARKEASETLYWIELIHEAEFIDDVVYESIKADCLELLKILTSSIRTTFVKIERTKRKPKDQQ